MATLCGEFEGPQASHLPKALMQCIMHALTWKERMILVQTSRDWLHAARDPFAWKHADPCLIDSSISEQMVARHMKCTLLHTFLLFHLDLTDRAFTHTMFRIECFRARLTQFSCDDSVLVNTWDVLTRTPNLHLTTWNLTVRGGTSALRRNPRIFDQIGCAFPRLTTVHLTFFTYVSSDVLAGIQALPHLTSLSIALKMQWSVDTIAFGPPPSLRHLLVKCHDQSSCIIQFVSLDCLAHIETLVLDGYVDFTNAHRGLAFDAMCALRALHLSGSAHLHGIVRDAHRFPVLSELFIKPLITPTKPDSVYNASIRRFHADLLREVQELQCRRPLLKIGGLCPPPTPISH